MCLHYTRPINYMNCPVLRVLIVVHDKTCAKVAYPVSLKVFSKLKSMIFIAPIDNLGYPYI